MIDDTPSPRRPNGVRMPRSKTATFQIDTDSPTVSTGRSDESYEESFRIKLEQAKAQATIGAPPIPRSFRPEPAPGLVTAEDESIEVVRKIRVTSDILASTVEDLEA